VKSTAVGSPKLTTTSSGSRRFVRYTIVNFFLRGSYIFACVFALSEDNVDNSRKPNGAKAVPPTPSKVLFSPGLRTDPATGAVPHPANHHHLQNNLHEQDEEEDEEDVDENHLADGAPSTPTVEAIPAPSGNDTPQQQEQVEEEDDCDEFNPYQFIAYLPPHASVCIMDKICLPALTGPAAKKQDLLTLALDLDETLVHCTVEPIAKPDLVFPVK
jgi:hypothetical protein